MSLMRIALRDQFLAQHNYLPEHLEFLASDMSLRRYYRLKNSQRILMDAPISENPHQFILLAQYLQTHGLRPPFIYGHHLDHGFVWLEDFGDQTYSKILMQAPERESELYQLAVHILQHLHQQAQERPPFIEEYTMNKLLKEAEVFIDWYWPATQAQSGYLKAKEDYLSAWQKVFLKMPSLPYSLVLRDYHVDNLMVVSGEHPLHQCGLLDFQDAIWGPVVYDFISLIEDARRDVNRDLQEQLWEIFLKDVSSSERPSYRLGATILGAGRHVKVIGVFTRFALKRKRKEYLQNLPRLWNYLSEALKQPALEPVFNWFESYLPLSKQSIPHL